MHTVQTIAAPVRGRSDVLTLIFAGAVAARAAMLIYATDHPERFEYPDSRRYAIVAQSIARGYGPIESIQNRTGTDPLYPYLLAPAWRMSGATLTSVYEWARLTNVLLGILGLAAVMGIARRIAGDAAAVAAGVVYAIDPILLFFHALTLTEIPFIGLFWSAIYCMVRIRERPSPLWAIAAGSLLGLSVLTRSSALPLALLLPLVAFFGGAGLRRERLVVMLLTWAAMIITIAPAAIRNHRLLGHWVPVRTGMGASLLEAWGEKADGGPGMEKVAWPSLPAGADEYQRDAAYRRAALDWAADNPGRVLRLALSKAARTWSIRPNAPGYESARYAAIGWLTVAPIYVLAFVGLRRLARCRELVERRQPRRSGASRIGMVALLLAPAVYFTLVHMIFVGSVRYRVPCMPGLFILAAAAVAPWLERRIARRPSFPRPVS